MRIAPLIIGMAALAAASGAAAQETCGRSSETVSAVQETGGVAAASGIGRSASVCGDNWSAANLFEREVARRPTVQARFNLAAAYAATERFDAAREVYRTVVADGQFTNLVLDVPAGVSGQRSMVVNASDEARRREIEMTGRMSTDLSTAAIDPAAAEDFGQPAIAEVAGEPRTALQALIDRTHVPADRALQFDGLAPAE